MKRSNNILAATVIAAIVIPASVLAGGPPDAPFPRIVGFGDSLSDAGNRYILTGEQAQAPYAPIPGAAYAIGGHHFTNGATWLELLAKDFKDPLGGKPSLRPNRRTSNYAFGGARAAGGQWPDLATQVSFYLDDNGTADSDALHVIWIGGNDVRDALALLQQGNVPAAIGSVSAAVQAVGSGILNLYGSGARSFLVANVPNLAILPAVQATNNPQAIAAAAFLSGQFNSALETALGALDALPGSSITRLDVATILAEVHATPEAFGLENSTTPCLSFFVIANAVCARPGAHLFWDMTHPTTRAHRILADTAFGLLTSP